MTSPLHYLTQGPRIFLSSWKNRIVPKKYYGTAEEICQQIVKDCWNGHFFQTSTNNFPQFWTRDFGFCTHSLLKLGYQEEVHATLRYALNRFKKYHLIATTITPGGKPFDFPTAAVDSLPWLLHSIKIAKFPYHDFKPFLNTEIEKFFRTFINEQTGLVKPDLRVSSIKDFALRKSSCYDNCLVALLAKDLPEMKLDNPFSKFHYPQLIQRHFWNGKFFYDDLTKGNYIAGDANIFPFVLGIVRKSEMLESVIQEMKSAGLDQPFPLKYTSARRQIKFIAQEMFMREYESNSIWTHLGPLYIKLVQALDKSMAAEYKQSYRELIEHHENYLEVFFADGKPFRSPFYYCDRGMLWAANYLTL